MRIINRITNKWSAVLGFMFCAALACSCGSDDGEILPEGGVSPDQEVADPPGTITLSMRDAKNGNTYLGNDIHINNENFSSSWEQGMFTSLGPVKGLGNVAHIPTTGWASAVAVVPGNGYVAYSPTYYKGKFFRIYVKDYIVSTTGGIIGAEVKYQEPFKGKDETISLDAQALTFPSEGGTQTLTFRNQGVILFDAECDAPWCTVQKTSTYDRPFLTNGVAITVEGSASSEATEGTVTLTTLHGKKTLIKVTRSGAEPYISFGGTEEKEMSAAQQTEAVPLTGNIAFANLTAGSSASWCKAELVDNTTAMQARSRDVKFVGGKPAGAGRAAGENSSAAMSYSLKLSLDENAATQPRNATVTVKSKDGKASATLKVVQKGVTFEVKNSKIGFDKNANYRTVTINTTVKDWEAESSADWCTFSKNGNQITIRATASTEDRTAVVSFKGFDTKITVHQSKYAVDDEFSENGIEGTVGYIGDEVRYVYKNAGETICAWSTESVQTGAVSRDDGEYNMSVIKKIPYWEDSYPAFLLCEQLNTNGVTGWYLPAIDELLLLRLTNSYAKYWSSTEYDKDKAIYRNRNSSSYTNKGISSGHIAIAVQKF